MHNQINPATKFLMILLRVAIGWHLMFEGYVKLAQSDILPKWGSIATNPKYARKFSSEQYLRESTGPLRFYFRGLVDDFHGTNMLTAEFVGSKWDNYVTLQSAELELDADSKKAVESLVDERKADLATYLQEKAEDIETYKQDVQAWEDREQRPLPGWGELPEGELLRPAMPELDWQQHKKVQQKLNDRRKELIAPILAWSDEIAAALAAQVQERKAKAAGAVAGELAPQHAATVVENVESITWQPQLESVNTTTMWGLTIAGALMILGLFTRTACLAGAMFLALFYLSMPPWPGLDPAPIAEGTYLYVNKNLIELIACVMLATTPVGVWGGLDSIIRGLITRPIFGVGKREVPQDE